MRAFRPSRLLSALDEVRENHRQKGSDLEDGRISSGSPLVEHLIRKFRSFSEPRRLLAALSSTERRLVGALLEHPSPDVSRRVLELLALDTTLVSTRSLWLGVQNPSTQEHHENLARLLMERPDLGAGQRLLLEGEGPQFLSLAHESGYSFDEACERTLVRSERWRQGLRNAAVESGSTQVWDLFEPEELRTMFSTASDTLLTSAMTRLYTSSVHPSSVSKVPSVRSLVMECEGRAWETWDLTDEVRRFLGTLVRFLRLQEFFWSDNERFAFWSRYLDVATDVQVDSSRDAVFLDFGAFGVIEFADVGNAGYVYPADYFQELKAKMHWVGSLKNRSRAIDRIIHSANWQGNTRYLLRRLGL